MPGHFQLTTWIEKFSLLLTVIGKKHSLIPSRLLAGLSVQFDVLTREKSSSHN